MKKEILINLILLVVTLIVIMFVLEGASRLIFGKNLRYSYTNDTLWELEPNQIGFSLPNGVLANVNSAGFRGEEVELQKTVPRVAMLGGSIGFGWGVKDEDTLSEQLEVSMTKKGKDIETLNLGEAGYGIFQMIAKYEKVGEQFDPDYVIILFASSNVLAQPDIDKGTQWKSMLARKLLRKSTLAAYLKPKLGFLRYFLTGVGKQNETLFLKPWEKDSQRLLEFDAKLKSEGRQLILLPYTYENEHELFYQTVLEFAKQHDIAITGPLHPALDVYRQTNNPDDLVVEDGHPSGVEFGIAADIVAETLLEQMDKSGDVIG